MTKVVKLLPLLAAFVMAPALAQTVDPHAGHHSADATTAPATTPAPMGDTGMENREMMKGNAMPMSGGKEHGAMGDMMGNKHMSPEMMKANHRGHRRHKHG